MSDIVPRPPGSRNNPTTSVRSLGSGRSEPLSSISRVGADKNKPLTSINNLNNNGTRPVTSVAHLNSSTKKAITSIAQAVNPNIAHNGHTHEYSAKEEEAITDSLREKFIVRRLKEKRVAAEEAKKKK